MISQSETKVAAALGVNGMAYYWDQYFNPILQGVLLIFTIVAMFMLIMSEINLHLRWRTGQVLHFQ